MYQIILEPGLNHKQKNNMKDLIHALNIFLKYGNPEYPTWCGDEILVVNIHPELVSKEDIEILDVLGFFIDEDENDCFKSFKFGSI